MRQMFSKKQIEEMIEEGSLSPEEVQEMLIGKYVRIMDAPESTTLTDEQIDQIKEGVFINGTFLALKNPILCPASEYSGSLYGAVIGSNESAGATFFVYYKIVLSTKVITLNTEGIEISRSGNTNIPNLKNLNGKTFPNYPSATGTFVLKCVDGVLTWVEEV